MFYKAVEGRSNNIKDLQLSHYFTRNPKQYNNIFYKRETKNYFLFKIRTGLSEEPKKSFFASDIK